MNQNHQDREPGMEFQIKKPFAYAINCFPPRFDVDYQVYMCIHIHTLDSFLTCAPRNRPRNRCNYASRNLLFLIVDFSILSSFHRIVEKPRMKLESLISLPLGWRTPASICPQFLERIHGSMIRRQEEEISVWLTTHRD